MILPVSIPGCTSIPGIITARSEVLARDSGLSEPEVADRVLALSEEKAPNTPEHHIGYYLAGEGRQALDIHLLQTPQDSYACGTVSTE